jgi:hypothetical protein
VSEAVPFEEVWRRIAAHERGFFRTQSGAWFTYRIDGDTLRPSRSDVAIPRRDFELAYAMVPFPSPAKVGRFVRGANYVHAVLHDERISGGSW